jgi:hypothetical protein
LSSIRTYIDVDAGNKDRIWLKHTWYFMVCLTIKWLDADVFRLQCQESYLGICDIWSIHMP